MSIRTESERPWADLSDLPLHKIFSLIHLDSRRIMFSLVCKSWNSISQSLIPYKQHYKPNTTDSSPHLLFSNTKLYHPILDKVCELNKFPETILGVKLHTTKEDWLLLTQSGWSAYYSGKYRKSKAFFFNPFTRAILWLPDFPCRGILYSMCFTSSPASSDFKVVAVKRIADGIDQWEKIVIDTIKCGEDTWISSEYEFREDSLFDFSYCNPVLCKGMCYILDTDSKLLIYNEKEKTFFIHEAPDFFLSCDVQQRYMLESEGKLLAVFVNTSGSWVVVCKWNVSKRKWEKLENLGNKVLFLSRPYSLSETVTTIDLGNRIYFPRLVGNRCLFYSLNTKKFHTSDGFSHNSFHGSKSAFSSTWIKPQVV